MSRIDESFAFEPLAEIAAALARGAMSSRELLDFYVRRIEAFSELNAVVALDERAQAWADEADRQRAAGRAHGALHGVPMTVKDSLETAGLRTTSGVPELAEHVPGRDADAVARLRSAGAIVFGKTNLPAWAGDLQTDNKLFGRTLNPWDHDRSPGGSSGGAAAAVAAGLVAAELGSDIGGSIRQPAANCGVFGLKPSYGIVPIRGHIPGPPGALADPDVAVVGPIARGAGDLDLLLDVVAGPDERSTGAWRVELPPPQVRRIACWFDDEYPLDSEVRALLESAADELGAEAVRPPVRLRDVLVLYQRLLAPLLTLVEDDESVERWRDEAARRGEPPDPTTRAAWEHWGGGLHRAWLAANEERWRLRAAWAEELEGFDAVLMPVTPVPSAPHQPLQTTIEDRSIVVDGSQRPWRELSPWLWVAGLLHLPAAAAPVGLTAAGLPVGVQVVGRYGGDRTTIEVARRVGRFVPPPRYAPSSAAR